MPSWLVITCIASASQKPLQTRQQTLIAIGLRQTQIRRKTSMDPPLRRSSTNGSSVISLPGFPIVHLLVTNHRAPSLPRTGARVVPLASKPPSCPNIVALSMIENRRTSTWLCSLKLMKISVRRASVSKFRMRRNSRSKTQTSWLRVALMGTSRLRSLIRTLANLLPRVTAMKRQQLRIKMMISKLRD